MRKSKSHFTSYNPSPISSFPSPFTALIIFWWVSFNYDILCIRFLWILCKQVCPWKRLRAYVQNFSEESKNPVWSPWKWKTPYNDINSCSSERLFSLCFIYFLPFLILSLHSLLPPFCSLQLFMRIWNSNPCKSVLIWSFQFFQFRQDYFCRYPNGLGDLWVMGYIPFLYLLCWAILGPGVNTDTLTWVCITLGANITQSWVRWFYEFPF